MNNERAPLEIVSFTLVFMHLLMPHRSPRGRRSCRTRLLVRPGRKKKEEEQKTKPCQVAHRFL